jgi:excinuclease ABC subunit A
VLVVEHDEQMMRAADWLVDMGPGAGRARRARRRGGAGGEGRADARSSITGSSSPRAREIACPERRVEDHGSFWVRGASMHNLKDIDVEFPIGKFVCVTGVSAREVDARERDRLQGAREPAAPDAHEAGRPRRCEGIECFDKVIDIDQSPIGRTPRSNPATYTKLFDHIRELYSLTPEAKVRGYKPGRFSFNVRGGRCETCKGDGRSRSRCTSCRRLRPVRDVQGRAIQPRDARGAVQGQVDRDVLEMSVEEALRSSRRSRSCAGGCRRCTTSGSTTSSSVSRRRRSRAARRSA